MYLVEHYSCSVVDSADSAGSVVVVVVGGYQYDRLDRFADVIASSVDTPDGRCDHMAAS